MLEGVHMYTSKLRIDICQYQLCPQFISFEFNRSGPSVPQPTDSWCSGTDLLAIQSKQTANLPSTC